MNDITSPTFTKFINNESDICLSKANDMYIKTSDNQQT